MKKIVAILVTAISILLICIFASFTNILSNSINKLRADISYPTSNGVKITCDKDSVGIDETATCTLTGYLSGGASGVSGQVVTQGGIQLLSVTKASGWTDMEEVASSTPDTSIISYIGGSTGNQFIIATMTIKGVSAGSSSIQFTHPPFGGETNVLLTTPDDTTVEVDDTSYTVNVTDGSSSGSSEQESSNNNLSELRVSIPPSYSNKITNFDANTLNYTVTVPYEPNYGEHYYIDVKATPADSGATVSITDDGAVDIISVSSKTVTIEVTAPNGSKKTYTVTINKAAPNPKSTDAQLKSLTVAGATITPSFDKDIYNYNAVVQNSVSSVTISAESNDTKATVTGDTGTKTLVVGDNTFTILVTAEDTTKTKTYTIKISREEAIDPTKSSDNSLKSLSIDNVILSPTFNKDILSYKVTVDNSVSKINIRAAANDTNATIDGDGQKDLNDIENSFNIIVTAEDNSKKIYTVVVTKKVIPVTCTNLTLTSTVYKVDNDKLIVSNVNKDHNVDTIKSNLSTSCGTISVSENKVVLSSDTQIKEYKIERVWMPKTGQNVIKYTLIIGVLALIIGALLFIKKKMDK